VFVSLYFLSIGAQVRLTIICRKLAIGLAQPITADCTKPTKRRIVLSDSHDISKSAAEKNGIDFVARAIRPEVCKVPCGNGSGSTFNLRLNHAFGVETGERIERSGPPHFACKPREYAGYNLCIA